MVFSLILKKNLWMRFWYEIGRILINNFELLNYYTVDLSLYGDVP